MGLPMCVPARSSATRAGCLQQRAIALLIIIIKLPDTHPVRVLVMAFATRLVATLGPARRLSL